MKLSRERFSKEGFDCTDLEGLLDELQPLQTALSCPEEMSKNAMEGTKQASGFTKYSSRNPANNSVVWNIVTDYRIRSYNCIPADSHAR